MLSQVIIAPTYMRNTLTATVYASHPILQIEEASHFLYSCFGSSKRLETYQLIDTNIHHNKSVLLHGLNIHEVVRGCLFRRRLTNISCSWGKGHTPFVEVIHIILVHSILIE